MGYYKTMQIDQDNHCRACELEDFLSRFPDDGNDHLHRVECPGHRHTLERESICTCDAITKRIRLALDV